MRTLNVYSYLTIGFLEEGGGTFLAFEQGWELFEFSNSKKLIRMRLKKTGIFTETRKREKQRMMGGFKSSALH